MFEKPPGLAAKARLSLHAAVTPVINSSPDTPGVKEPGVLWVLSVAPAPLSESNTALVVRVPDHAVAKMVG